MMAIVFSSSLLIAQVNPAISVHNPKAEITKQTQDLTLQKELDLLAEHGPTVVVPEAEEGGGSRAVGDDCTNPIVVTFPAAFPYSDVNYTCGRLNDYVNTDLGSYDGGEDIIYQFVVTATTGMSIDFDPAGTTYTGIGLFNGCPAIGNSVAFVTGSSGTTHKFIQKILLPGTYYLMADTWPTPNCIPTFNLNVTLWTPPPGADCSTAFNYGNVNGPAINGTLAAGQSVWYSFTSPGNMMTSVSLCAGASMDTKLDIYTACGAAVLFTNDDICGLLSRIDNIQLPAGQTYYARVYGYSSSTAGPFNISITGVAPPANDNCTTAQPLSGPYPQVVNGTTIGAFTDCAGILNWNAVWYSINLPFSVNNLTLDFCGNSPALTTVGIVYYNNCSDCNAYTIMSSASCTGGWKLTTLSIPGPGTVYFPAYVGATGRNFQFTVNVTSTGDLDGHVTNYYGVAIGGATVAIEELGLSTTTDPAGYYLFEDIPVGLQEVTCTKSGYNPVSADITIIANTLVTHDFILTQPNMVVQPLIVEETLNPNEYFTFSMSVLNNGTGQLDWAAAIVYPETAMPVAPTNNFDLVEYLASIPSIDFNTTGDPTGLAPMNNPNPLPELPPMDLRDFDSQAFCYNAYSPSAPMGFYNFFLNAPGAWTLYGTALPGGDFMTGSSFVEDILYGTNYYGQQFFTIDQTTGATTILGNLSVQLQGIAYDYTTETMYGIGGSNGLYTINLANGALTLVASVPAPGGGTLIDLACDNDGNLISVPVAFSGATPIGLIDKTTGAWTTLGNPPITALYAQGMSCDHTTNTIYWASYSSGGVAALYIVDQTNGACTLIGGFPGNAEVDGLAIPGAGGVGGWLTMDYLEGSVEPFGGVDNIPTHMDATGTEAGQVYTAEIVFTSDPNVSTITVPVTMIIAGNPLNPPEDLTVELVDDIIGVVEINWTWTADALQYFLIKRNGVVIGTTTATNYTDLLPDYGTYCYTVQAVYDEGSTAPAGPECIEWPNPDIFVSPNDLWADVWAGGYEEDVNTTIYNNGEGTLAFSFPLFAAMDLLNNPDIEKNQPGAPFEMRQDESKGEELYAGQGYPVILGAGGPDSYGYVWIDSDEPGGPGYSWLDISATGTLVTNPSDDGTVGPFPMGFGFNFYGENKTQFWISGNGSINFKSTAQTLGNTAIPTNSTTYNDFIAWFWDDMGPHYAGVQIFRQSFADYAIVQFNNMCRYGNTTDNLDAQVIMYANGKIKIQYKDITAGFPLTGGTIGIQSSTPSVGLQVAFNTTYVHNNLALQFALPAQFIVDVQPAFGTVAQNSSIPVAITYSSLGRNGVYYDPGTYTEDLELESNDQDTPTWIIYNTMVVYTPATIAGLVTDCNNDNPLTGVTVSAGAFQTFTDGDGEYSMVVDPGTYDVYFDKVGYQSEMVDEVTAPEGVVTTVDVCLWDAAYPPGFVHAEVMDEDTWCEVTWTLPAGPYEISFDDGSAEDFVLWQSPGSQNAVKFTPAGYPATVVGGRLFVGDGSFSGPFLGTDFSIVVYDDDGTNGLPGTMVDSVGVTVNNYGWVTFSTNNPVFTSGNFYVSMYQTATAPNAAPLGVDTDLPTYYRSYSKFGSGNWAPSVYQDFMIRAYVSGSTIAASQPEEVNNRVVMQKIDWSKYLVSASGTIPRTLSGVEKNGTYRAVEGMTNRDVTEYSIARFEAPGGVIDLSSENHLDDLTGLVYGDYAWAGLDQGWYAYGVKVLYTSGEYSAYAFSNIVGHRMDFTVTINVTLSTGAEPSGVQVSMTPFEYPFQSYAAVTPASGTVEFDPVWKGKYTVKASKLGFDTFDVDYVINNDMVIDIVLGEVKYPPTNLYVDPLTLIATWNEPYVTVLDKEDFEALEFPPADWTITQTDYNGGWERSEGYSGSWVCPAGDGYFALANDDGYISHSGAMDRLITPMVNLQAAEGFGLTFDYFYDGMWGGSAYLEYSVDGGSTWEQILQFSPVGNWTSMEVDLTSLSGAGGMEQIWFAFHYDDNGYWADGLAVDNVKISVPGQAANYIDFYLFLDDAFHGTSLVTTYDYAPLDYGVTYTASVAAHYTSGLSAKSYYTFDCVYLLPPTNLTGTAPDDAVILLWEAPLLPDMSAINVPAFTGTLPENDRTVSILPDPSPEHVTGGGDPLAYLSDRGSKAYGQDLLATDLIKYDVGTYTYTTFGSAPQSFFGGDFGKTDTMAFYAIDYNSNALYSINKGTGVVTPIGGNQPLFGGGSFTGMACDKTTGVMYIAYTNISQSQIGTVDLATGAKTPIGPTTTVAPGVIEIAIDGTGQMYAWDIVNDASYLVDKATGVFTLLGALGLDLNYAQGGNWDPITDQIFMSAYSSSGLLCVLDRTTGAATVLTSLPSEFDVFAFPGGGSVGPGGGGIPENLLGYNIYREGDFLSYVAHPTLSYVDEGLEPGVYCYTVTAVYDLTPYDHPGETGESMEEGPACVTVEYCFDLEFMETWNLGNFADNQWQTGTANWFINGQLGNPAPAAEFTWDPILTDYSSTLTSYPLCASGMTEGKLWLDYDVKLGSVNSTGEEMLLVEVWNWDANQWSTVATYNNAEGGFDWTPAHVNITANAMNKVFKIRFNAMGANTLDILNWFVDNIHVYRVCDAPTDLTSILIAPDLTDVELTWVSPAGGPSIDEWIQWDDGVNFDAIGANAAIEFDVAARWNPAQLVNYEGASVTQIAFYPYEAAATYRVRVWTGVSGSGPANMVVDQAVTNPIIDSWNYITLITPVMIDVTKDLWIGYYINATTGWPAGCDNGPAIDGSGNMINWGGWQTLLELAPAFDYNWNIQGYVQSLAGAQMPLGMEVETYSVPAGSTISLNNNYTPANPVFAGTNGSRELTGFNIWRNFDGGNFEIIGNTDATTYVDPGVAPNGLYCYMVQAVYQNETDQCESALSNETCEVLTVSITDPNATAGSFNLYPNPANDHVFISTSGDLKRVTVYNALGQLVIDEITTGKQYELKTTTYTIGVYMVRVETAAGVTTRTLTIQR